VTRRLRITAAAIFAGLLLCGAGRLLAAPPPDADGAGVTLDNQAIHRDPGTDADSPAPAKSPTGTATPTAGGFDSARVVIALVTVVGLIFAIRSGLRWFFPGVVPQRSTRAMQVLCRFTISPRQHLILVQVGKRLIVVGDGGAQLNPLCEITAAEEVEAIVTQVREESASSLKRFELFFGKARKTYTEEPTAEEMGQPAAEPVPAPESPDARFDPTHELTDPSLTETRDELSGLSQKVRDLAKQLGRS
jgi:flagellar biogenesis protein FliO